MKKKEVVIIGAGPAGLTAAYELLRNPDNYHVTILEESEKIGGISQTICHNGKRIDIGGHRFFSKSQRVMKWWNQQLPLQGMPAKDDKALGRNCKLASTGGCDPEKEDAVMLIRHRISRIYYNGKFFDYPVSMKLETFRNMGFCTAIRAGMSYLHACVRKLPEDSLEAFYINRFGRVLYSMFFESYTEKVWGRHPSAISADWGAQRVKGLSIRSLLWNICLKMIPGGQKKVETSLIEEFYYPKHGPGQLWECVAEKIMEAGGEIRFNCRVDHLEKNEFTITGVHYDGGTIPADYVISSMPLSLLVKGIADVPGTVRDIAAGLPYRDFITVGLLVERLALKNETKIPTLGNIVPDCWIYVQDAGVKLGRIQIFNNWSPYMLPDPEHQVWIGLEYFCQEGDAFWDMEEQESIAFAAAELKKIGVLDQDTKILDSCRVKMKKAYPAYFDTYAQIDELVAYLNRFDNLYCVGRNGQHRYNNMDHSMMTAFCAAEQIMTGKMDKEALWSVNTEQSYHEKYENHREDC